MKTTPVSPKNSRPTPPKRMPVLLFLLVTLSGIAIYVWTLPGRKEKALRAADISQLIALSKQEPNNPRVFYHLGLRLQSLGQRPPARAAFARAADLDGDDEEAWLAWATAADALGNDQEAFAALSTFVQHHPQSELAHRGLATFYYTQEAMPRAYEEALSAAKLNPKDGAAWRLAGLAAIGLEKYALGEDAFRQAVQADPKDWRALMGLGDALDRGEKRREALEIYRQASALAPTEPAPTLAIGRLMFTLATTPAEFSAAREVLERAVKQDPTAGHPWLWLGRAYIRENQWDKARQTLEHAKQVAPSDYGVAYELQKVYAHQGNSVLSAHERKRHDELYAYYLNAYNLLGRLHEAKGEQDRQLRLELSRLYATHGDYGKAAREYRQLVRRAPDLTVAQQELAEVERKLSLTIVSSPSLPVASAPANVSTSTLLKDGETMLAQQRYPEAQAAFAAAFQRDPKLAQAAEGLGLALEGQGKTDEAFTALNQALTLNPSLPKAQVTAAKMYFNIGLPDEATRRMEKLVKQVPNDPEYLRKLGVCYQTTNRPEQAAAMFARATALAPDNPAYWSDLAGAEVKSEQPAQAEAHYRRAAKLAPNDPDILARLGTFLLDHRTTSARQQEAETLFRTTLAASPQNESALLGLGRLQVLRKNPKEAVTLLESLINKNPDIVQAYYELARAYDQQGNAERAAFCRKAFQTISDFRTERDNTEEQTRLHQKDPNLRLKLARLYARDAQYAKAINQYQVCLHLDPKNTGAQKELTELSDRLKAKGQLASALTFNAMVSASLNQK